MITRDEALAMLDDNFKAFMDCLGQLTEEELTVPPVTGAWTVKDVIAHVWSWGDEVLRTVKAWGEARPWQAGVTYNDAWSEAQVIAKSALPLITVVDGATSVHRRLMHQLYTLSDEMLTQVDRAPWGEEMPLVELFHRMAEHYARHAQDLKAYQERCLASDN